MTSVAAMRPKAMKGFGFGPTVLYRHADANVGRRN